MDSKKRSVVCRMSMKYKTSLDSQVPYSPSPLSGLASPYSYNGAHGDVLRSKSLSNAASADVSSQRAAADYQLAQQQAQNALVSQGLQMLSRDRRNKINYDTDRLNAMYGISNQLLRGLFG